MNNIRYIHKIRLTYEKTDIEPVKVGSTQTASEFIRCIFPEGEIELREYSYVVFLDNTKEITAYYWTGTGDNTGHVVSVKHLVAAAVLSNATMAFIAHNHPSGNIDASTMDVDTARDVFHALAHVGVKLIDAIIVTKDSESSYLSRCFDEN